MSVENIIKADVDVQYQWGCEYIGDREKVILLDEIVCLYVTIRGFWFSFAKSWLEMFKKDEYRNLKVSERKCQSLKFKNIIISYRVCH